MKRTGPNLVGVLVAAVCCALAAGCPKKDVRVTAAEAPSAFPDSAPETPSASTDEVRKDLWLPLLDEADREKDAKELERLGFALHGKGDFEAAARYFGAASEKDPGFAKAHFNLACALSRLRGEGKSVDIDQIIGALHRAWAINPLYAENIRKDGDLAPIRDADDYLALLEWSGKPEFLYLSRRFPEASFRFRKAFMYRNETSFLIGAVLDGKRGVIPLRAGSSVDLEEGVRGTAYDVFIADDAAISALEGRSEADGADDLTPFGDIGLEGMSRSVIAAFFDPKDGSSLAERAEGEWRVSVGIGSISFPKAVKGANAFSMTSTQFSSGWYEELRVYALSSGQVVASMPMTIASEDLSGGGPETRGPDADFGDPRLEGGSIVMDRYEDGRVAETMTLLDLP